MGSGHSIPHDPSRASCKSSFEKCTTATSSHPSQEEAPCLSLPSQDSGRHQGVESASIDNTQGTTTEFMASYCSSNTAMESTIYRNDGTSVFETCFDHQEEEVGRNIRFVTLGSDLLPAKAQAIATMIATLTSIPGSRSSALSIDSHLYDVERTNRPLCWTTQTFIVTAHYINVDASSCETHSDDISSLFPVFVQTRDADMSHDAHSDTTMNTMSATGSMRVMGGTLCELDACLDSTSTTCLTDGYLAMVA